MIRASAIFLVMSVAAGGLSGSPLEGRSIEEKHAAENFRKAEAYANSGRPLQAIGKFESMVSRYRETEYAAKAQFRIAELYRENDRLEDSFNAYQGFLDGFPKSNLYGKAISGQMAVVDRVLELWRREAISGVAPDKKKVPGKEELGKMMKIVKGNGRYTRFAPEILYKSGVVFQQERKNVSARAAFAEILEKHKKHELADDAGFQYAYIDFKKVAEGDWRSKMRAEIGMLDFLQKFPDSEKVPQAQHCLKRLREMEAARLVEHAQRYRVLGGDNSARTYLQKAFTEYPDETEKIKGARLLLNSLLKEMPSPTRPSPSSISR